MANLIGQTIGGYRIVEQIGLGGMATVYKAYQPSIDRYVAFKIISTHLTQDPTFVKRFEQEAKVIAKLEHVHILPVHDYGERDGCLYLVMRFIEGGTLKERMQGGPLSLDETRRVVTQVGLALEYAHQRGVVHRDLKPSNILIDSQGDCYLSDFGIAKMVEGTLGLTGSGVVGTPHYMAPEQGQSLKVDHRADIYAMGIVVYEMVIGRVPFDAETPFAVVLKHLTEPLPLPRALRPDLPEEVERVILKALAKDPADRYQSMRDLVTAFDQAASVALAEAPVVAMPSPVTPAPVASRPVKPLPLKPARAARPIWPLAAAGAALLALMGVGLVVTGLIASGLLIGGRRPAVAPPAETATSTPASTATATLAAETVVLAAPTPTTARPPSPPAVATEVPAASPVKPSPAPTSPPLPTATPQPTSAPAKSPLPAGSWQRIPDLPRQVNALAVDPTNPHVVYAGTGSSGAGSGVYKSEDAGRTWQLAFNGLPKEDVRTLALSYASPPTLYASAGGGQVFASTDGAQSWTRVGTYELTGFGGQLVVAPGNANLLFAAEDVRGAYRSLDGGHNWLAVSRGLPQGEGGDVCAQSVAIDPADSNVVYLGTGCGPFGGNGVYKSADGGENWSAANRGMIDYSITALAVDPANRQTVYAGANSGELFKSADGGATWSDLTANLPDGTSTIREIVMSPSTSGVVYLLGDLGVLVSFDGGQGWHLLGRPSEVERASSSTMAVIFDPQPVLILGLSGEGGWRYGPN